MGDWLPLSNGSHESVETCTLEENERCHILKALQLAGWKVSGENGAAKILRINPKTLESRMKKLNIKRQL